MSADVYRPVKVGDTFIARGCMRAVEFKVTSIDVAERDQIFDEGVSISASYCTVAPDTQLCYEGAPLERPVDDDVDSFENCLVDCAAIREHVVLPFCLHKTARSVSWIKAPNQRLAALNVLSHLPTETPLGDSIASALLLSCLDAATSIAHAALCSGWMSSAIDGRTIEEIMPFCKRLVELVGTANAGESDVVIAMKDIMRNQVGRSGLVAAGGCEAVVNALNSLKMASPCARWHQCVYSFAGLLCSFAEIEEGVAGAAATGGCEALVDALKIALDECVICE